MASGRPSDLILIQWYSAACTIDLNWATNEAFCSSYRVLTSGPSQSRLLAQPRLSGFSNPQAPVQAHKTLSPGNPVPMDINHSWRNAPLPISCYQYGKVGHKLNDCPMHFNVQAATIDKLQSYLKERLTTLDMALDVSIAEVEEEKDVNEDFPTHSE